MLIKYGDLFELGTHRLIMGDAKDPEIIKLLVGNEQIKLVLTDPPYGVGYVENKSGISQIKKQKAILNDHEQSEEEYRQFTREWIEIIKPYLSRKNSFYIFNSDRMLFALRKGMKEAGVKFAQLLIWVKSNAVVGRMNYLPQHELVAYGWYGSHEFMKSKDKSLLFYPKPNKSILHPTMKPVGLLRNLILNSTRIGDAVYDCFGGSGSTLVACEQTKRKCLMIELDLEYCQTILDRFTKLTGIKAKKIKE